MTTTPTTIKLSDLKATADPLRSDIGQKLAAAHTAVDATGDAAATTALEALHESLKNADDAYVGLFPNDASRPQPADGGGNKDQ